MNLNPWKAGALALSVVILQGGRAEAQWGYGWGGYGGASSVPGDTARGMGVLAAGAGQYNQATAMARSINADTAMRWNQYLYESQLEASRRYHQRMAQERYSNERASKKIADRLRDAPEPRDIYLGDALNVAFDEINNPRVYAQALTSAKVKIGGEAIRDIPFSYAAAAISTSMRQIMSSEIPPSLKTPEFADLRAQLKPLSLAIHKKIDNGEAPDRADVDKALAVVEAAEAKAEALYAANSPERNEAMRRLKALHGLLRMMETPAINVLLSGVEKRPEATLSDLIMFMNAYNLRFGPATTPRQREVYDMLYPKLVKLRTDLAPSLAAAKDRATEPAASDAGEYFSKLSKEHLKKPPPDPRP